MACREVRWECQIAGQPRKTADFLAFLHQRCLLPAEVGVTNVTSLRNATTTGRSCLGVPSQAVVGWPEVPRLS